MDSAMATISQKRILTGKWGMIAATVIGWSGIASADIRLPSIIGDHMVLQQGMPVPIWGKADPGQKVTVSFAGQTRETVTDTNGHWLVRLKPLKAPRNQAGQSMTIILSLIHI